MFLPYGVTAYSTVLSFSLTECIELVFQDSSDAVPMNFLYIKACPALSKNKLYGSKAPAQISLGLCEERKESKKEEMKALLSGPCHSSFSYRDPCVPETG